MKIIIKTQEELDALPKEFEEFTAIEIRSSDLISVRFDYKNARVNAYGSSRVNAYSSSRVNAYSSSTVYTYGSSRVNAFDSSTVYAYSSSTVYAYSSSRVSAFDSSTVYTYDSSRVNAYGSSRVNAYGSSRVNAYDSSSVYAFLLSYILVHSLSVSVKQLRDNSRLVYRVNGAKRPDIFDSTAIITEFSDIITPTFDKWLERGFVVADGICQKLVSQKTIGETTIYETDQGFVARIGDKFAHGKTIEQAKNDLRYKLSDRDTSKFKNWKLEDIKPTDEIIEAYMAVTGACSMGTKMFCESIKLKDEYKLSDILELTKGKYGDEQFSAFFKGEK